MFLTMLVAGQCLLVFYFIGLCRFICIKPRQNVLMATGFNYVRRVRSV